jgi:hypothetical protein
MFGSEGMMLNIISDQRHSAFFSILFCVSCGSSRLFQAIFESESREKEGREEKEGEKDRDGREVVRDIANSNSPRCPILILEK